MFYRYSIAVNHFFFSVSPLEHNPPLQLLSALEWAVSHAFRTVLLVIREVQSRYFHFTEGAKHLLQWTGSQVFVQSIPPLNLSTTIGALYLHKWATLPMVLHLAMLPYPPATVIAAANANS